MIDLENIFELFSYNNNSEGINEELYLDLTSTPVYWVGMYNKMIINHISFRKNLRKYLKNIDYPLDEDNVKIAGEYLVYNQAWNYISNIDLNDESHVLYIKKLDLDVVGLSFKSGIKFFEKYEDYEKCAFLKNILDTIN